MVQIRVFVYFRQIPFLKRKRCHHRVDHRRPPRVGIIHPPKRETISLGHYHHFIDYTDNRCRLIKKGMTISWVLSDLNFLKQSIHTLRVQYFLWRVCTGSGRIYPGLHLGPLFSIPPVAQDQFFWSSLRFKVWQCLPLEPLIRCWGSPLDWWLRWITYCIERQILFAMVISNGTGRREINDGWGDA